MPEPAEQTKLESNRLDQLASALESGTMRQVRAMLNALYPAEIAHLLESLPPEKREFLWELVDNEQKGDVLLYVNDDISERLIKQMETDQLLALTENLDVDDLADFIQELPGTVTHIVLQSMDAQNRQRLEAVLTYPEDTAGGLMNTDTITVRPDVTFDVVLRYLRRRGSLPEMTDNLFVVDRDNYYLGVIAVTDLVTKELTSTVAELLIRDFEAIPAELSDREVAGLFERRDLVSAPVIDKDGKLLGRITIDDVVDVIREDADHSFMSMAGLHEEYDMFAPVTISTRRRSVWLGVNLITALIASWVIGLFDTTIEKLVALAILMPIVASMGGIAGSQTLTLVIRGMAIGQIGDSNANRVLMKEFAVGALNGVLWAIVIGAVAVLWFKNYHLGVIIAAAVIINLLTAALAGASIPLIIRKLGADPALAGGVVLTTVTDVVGFLAFLGLAALFLV